MTTHRTGSPRTSVRVGDRSVHRVGLGTNRVTPSAEGVATLRRAVELGVNFIDTADVYQSGASEEAIGAAVPPTLGDVLVTTKGGMTRGAEGFGVDGRPEHLREAFENSLRRLRRDRLELYQLHRVDPHVPLEESVGQLRDLRREGRLRHVGLSNVSLSELERARRIVPVVSVQNRYNLFDRESEEVLRYCEANEIAFIPWSPIQRGRLANDPTLIRIAKRRSATPPQVALAWLLRTSNAMLPIPGTLSEEHLRQNLSALELDLEPEEMEALDGLSPREAPP